MYVLRMEKIAIKHFMKKYSTKFAPHMGMVDFSFGNILVMGDISIPYCDIKNINIFRFIQYFVT